MPVVDEDEIRAGDLEAKMKGKKPPSRCPLCLSECLVVSQDHPFGEGYVTEFLHMECPVCDVLYDCRQCYGYILHQPEKHPCREKLLEHRLCKCPPESTSSTSPETTTLSF